MVLIEKPWRSLARVPAMTLQLGVSDTLALPAVAQADFAFSRLPPSSGEDQEKSVLPAMDIWEYLNH